MAHHAAARPSLAALCPPATAAASAYRAPGSRPFAPVALSRVPLSPLPSWSKGGRSASECSALLPPSWGSPLAGVSGRMEARRSARGGAVCSALITTSVTAPDVAGMEAEIKEAEAGGADIVELRLDFLKQLDPVADVKALLDACSVPAIVTFRPAWEGGNYGGEEGPRVTALQTAAALGADYVDVELLAAEAFFKDGFSMPPGVKLILSNHDFEATPSLEELRGKIDAMWAAGADIAKLATTANDISDAITVLSLISYSKGPTIALAMGERGVITRLLAPKYGGYLTFAALEGRPSAPGQPTLGDMRSLYRAHSQNADTKVFGIVGNPVSHSRSPILHNRAMEAVGFNGVYVPLLVDDMKQFLKAFEDSHFAGFSVTIPHKEAALENADFVDPVAASIGAVNTLLRQADGRLSGYNTDWEAAINAIEDSMGGRGSLDGKTVVVLGAGGAGKALAFGAAQRGAHVKVANRSIDRARELVKSINGAEAVSLEEVASGSLWGDVLANTTAVGMHPMEDETPVERSALGKYALAFDAIYTPLETRLLAEAKAEGCATVGGLEMFVGQAVKQFEYFTGAAAPQDVVTLMRDVVTQSLNK